MAENMKNLGLRATEERWREMNQLALDRDTSVQKLFEDAMEQCYFTGKKVKEKEAPPEDETMWGFMA